MFVPLFYIYNFTVLHGAVEHAVLSAEDALSWLEAGNTARVTAATQMNQRSSRSHAVFTLHIGEQLNHGHYIFMSAQLSYTCTCI